MNTEQDTFNALRRLPFNMVVASFLGRVVPQDRHDEIMRKSLVNNTLADALFKGKSENKALHQCLKDGNWTAGEFFDACLKRWSKD